MDGPGFICSEAYMSKRFDFINSKNTRYACEQGSTFQGAVYIKGPFQTVTDLTGYTFRMQVRATADSSTVLLEITSSQYGSITAATGKISWTVPATITAAITEGMYYYDLELVSGSTVRRIIEGKFEVSAEVTR